MGTYSQSVVARGTITPEEAKRLGECIVAWLVDEEIIEHRLTECCLVDSGYPPGRHYRRACGGIDDHAREEDHAELLRSSPHGVELHTKRYCFFNSQGDFGPARCLHCAAERDFDAYYEASNEWMKGGIGELHCGHCGRTSIVTAWEHDDLLWSTLGLVFWGWPELSPAFLDELSRRIDCRVSIIFGKL
ncbi:MAG TPA: hypothetical protein VF774_29830 [Pseudoduganella sp.]|jgi:hypothetical protein